MAERIIAFRDKHSPDAVVVDGDGLGAGVVDQLQHRGYSKGLFEFHGGEPPRDFNMYFNHRSEVWGLMRDWFHNGGVEIPDDPELEVDLTGPEYGFSSKNQIQLERKEDLDEKLGVLGEVPERALGISFPPSTWIRIRDVAVWRYSQGPRHPVGSI